MKTPVFLRTAHNYDMSVASDESGLICSDPSLAQQQFREDSDINTIIRRFNLSGQLPQGVSAPQYGDFTAVTDYHSALNVVRAADEAFMALPAHVRKQFSDDPAAFVDFAVDPKNFDELEKMGLTVKRSLPESPKATLGEAASDSAPESNLTNVQV